MKGASPHRLLDGGSAFMSQSQRAAYDALENEERCTIHPKE